MDASVEKNTVVLFVLLLFAKVDAEVVIIAFKREAVWDVNCPWIGEKECVCVEDTSVMVSAPFFDIL